MIGRSINVLYVINDFSTRKIGKVMKANVPGYINYNAQPVLNFSVTVAINQNI